MKKFSKEEKGLILTAIILGIIIAVLSLYLYYPLKSTSIKQYPVDIIEITGDCEECFDINLLTDNLIKINNLKTNSKKTLNYNSQEGKEIINKYNIEKIPVLIVLSKNIKEIGIDEKVFSVNKDYAIFNRGVPYINLKDNKIKGIVNLIEIQPNNCIECTPLLNLKEQFEKLGLKIKDYEIIDSDTNESRQIIKENNLKFIPVLLISKEIKEYWWIFNQLKKSFIERENYYVLKDPFPPYINLNDNKKKGIVDITYIKNDSCIECFKVERTRDLFQSIGIYIENEKSIDISSSQGKKILEKYNITAIPTAVLSKEILDYKSIKELLEQVGTFERDGSFVFRKLSGLNTNYQKINQNE